MNNIFNFYWEISKYFDNPTNFWYLYINLSEKHIFNCGIRQNENELIGNYNPLCMDSIRPEEDFIDELRTTEFVRATKLGIKINIYTILNSE